MLDISRSSLLKMSLLLRSAILICFCVCNTSSDVYNSSLIVNNRQSRFGWGWGWGWGIGIVRFENKYCRAPDGSDGTCYTRRQCRELDGVSSGLCAGTIGYCCIIQRTCGATSSNNNTYFVNNNYPNTVTGSSSCTYVIQKCSSEICQVRIDFLGLRLATPDSMGACIYDSLRITGSASVVRPICGENTGHHIYLGFNGDSDITMSITTSGTYDIQRIWKIQVAQIACDSSTRAPDGCLMYYTERSGTVRSFNFAQSTSSEYYTITNPNIVPNRLPGTRELANLNYGVCIRMAPGFCSIEWKESFTGSFAVTGSTPGQFVNTAGCTTDYVLIPNPDTTQSTTTPDRFCGNTFPNTISSSKPFVLYVVTDGIERYDMTNPVLNDIGNLGFSLAYTQRACDPLAMT